MMILINVITQKSDSIRTSNIICITEEIFQEKINHSFSCIHGAYWCLGTFKYHMTLRGGSNHQSAVIWERGVGQIII